MHEKFSKFDIVLLFALLGLTVLSAFYFYPYAMEIPHRDSGIYLYIGSELLKGKTIYVDIWEHKPPLIFYTNALGLWLGSGSPWGLWGLEVAFLFLTPLVSYRTLRAQLKPLPSFLITSAAYLAVYQYMSGNFTEEYMLLFQALILLIFLTKRQVAKNHFFFFLIGILAGIVFNFKQTYIDVLAAIVIFLMIEMILLGKWKNVKLLLLIGTGFVVTNIVIILIMAVSHALVEWWKTAYVFNFSYSDIDIFERITALRDLFRLNLQYPPFVCMLLVWLFGFIFTAVTNFFRVWLFLKKRSGKLVLISLSGLCVGLLIFSQTLNNNKPGLGIIETIVLILFILFFMVYISTFIKFHPKKKSPREIFSRKESFSQAKSLSDAYFLGIINLPIVILLIVTSGRNYNHYFITLYPSMLTLFYGFIVYLSENLRGKVMRLVTPIFLLLIYLISIIQPAKRLLRGLGGPYSYNPYSDVIQYVQENSQENDTLMVWAMESGINYLTERSSPSRFSYVDPAYYDSPIKDEAQQTLYNDITSKPPIFILDMRNPDYPFIDGRTIEECLRAHLADGNYLDRTIRFACQNYEYIDRINNVEVYQLIQN